MRILTYIYIFLSIFFIFSDWKIGQGPTNEGKRTHLTGPPVDHTTRLLEGKYLYITHSPMKNDRGFRKDKIKEAWFVSPTLETMNIMTCKLRFHYYMYGEYISKLEVFIRDSIGGTKTLAFSRYGEQGQFWERAVVDSSIKDKKFQFVIVASKIPSNEERMDIAIDDVSFTKGCKISLDDSLPTASKPPPTPSPCYEGQFYCNIGNQCLPSYQQCDYIKQCSNGFDEMHCGPCDFEDDMCGWKYASTGMFSWKRLRPIDHSIYIKPSKDHTIQSEKGYFVNLIGSEGIEGKTAVLKSPPLLNKVSPYCHIELWFYVSRSMNVYIAIYSNYEFLDEIEQNLLYNMTTPYPNNDVWSFINVPVYEKKANTWFSIEATPVFDQIEDWIESKSLVAFDDITYFNCDKNYHGLDCSFDNHNNNGGLCNWKQDQTDQLDWSLSINDVGHKKGYIYADFGDDKASDKSKARLISTIQTTNEFWSQLTFRYYMAGTRLGCLRVYAVEVETQNEINILRSCESRGDQWLSYARELSSLKEDYTVIIEVEWVENGNGLVKVDDVFMKSSLHTHECTFEVDYCQWSNAKDGDINWFRGSPNHNLTIFPPIDHTGNSENGHFIYPDRNSNKIGAKAYLVSPTYKSVGTQCLQFWYHMKGLEIGILQISVKDLQDGLDFKEIWSHSAPTWDIWTRGLVTIEDMPEFIVRFEAINGWNPQAMIALDDINFVTGACPLEFLCTFETDMCMWHNAEEDEDTFDWRMASGVMVMNPPVDHSSGYPEGRYLLANIVNKKKGDSAKLKSSLVPSYHSCISIWVYMQNIEKCSLSIWVLGEGAGEALTYVHNTTTENIWEEVVAYFPDQNTPYEAMIMLYIDEDITSTRYKNVAIDDLLFSKDCNQITTSIPTTPPPTHLPSVLDCDFEQTDSLCSWTQAGAGINWMIGHGTTPMIETGPDSDHTTESKDGKYIYVSTTKEEPREARLQSLLVDIGKDGSCLTFWYHMHGFHVGYLSVYIKLENNTEIKVWEQAQDHSPYWVNAQIDISISERINIIIESVPFTTGHGDIAIDDISFDNFACPSGMLCNFEHGNCGFELPITTDGQSKWEIVKGVFAGDSIHAPKFDHSTMTRSGHYMLMKNEGRAEFLTQEILTAYTCVIFWAYVDGISNSNEGELEIYMIEGHNEKFLISISEKFGGEWQEFKIQIDSDLPYRLSFRGEINSRNKLIFAIDDVKPIRYCEKYNECTFEDNDDYICIWKNIMQDDLDWSRTTGDAHENIYAPVVDLTLGTAFGGFAYVDTEIDISETSAGGTAVMKSQILPFGEWCISFYYHIQGRGPHALELRIETLDFTEKKIWSDPGGVFHADWKYANVSVVPDHFNSDGSFFLKLVAISYKGLAGIVAVDNLEFNRKKCEYKPPPDCLITCEDTCITEDQMCNFVLDCKSGQDEIHCGYNCTFEERNSCGWENTEHKGNVAWALLNGFMSSNVYGPPVDHTTLLSEGSYMAVRPIGGFSSPVLYENNLAQLNSPVLHNTATTCRVTFWYFLYSQDPNDKKIGSVIVQYQVSDIIIPILSIKDSQEKEWKQQEVYIGRVKPNFQIQILGERNLRISGYVAIDDIQFENCFLPTPSSPQECSHFTCNNKACISIYDKCDFVDDCGDNSDEDDVFAQCNSYYGRCNFEHGSICDWTQEGANNWIVDSANGNNLDPPRDHTLNIPSGHYIYISNENSVSREAILTSPVITGDSNSIIPCLLRFFYYIDGRDVHKLDISTRNAENGPIRSWKTIDGNAGPYWEEVEMLLPAHEINGKSLQFLISASVNNSSNRKPTVIAIDDISFTITCRKSKDGLPPYIKPSSTTPSPCNNDFKCNDGQCISKEYECNFKYDCLDHSDEEKCAPCDFEESVCGWKDVSYGLYFWTREKPSISGHSGLVMEVTKQISGLAHEARLETKKLGSTIVSCMVDYYFVVRTIAGTEASLELKILTARGYEYTIWHSPSDTGDHWHHNYVGVGEHDYGWKLMFTAYTEDDNSVIAIDDIDFHNCTLGNPNICKPNEYPCYNGQCIDRKQMCDFSNDCGDNSDEDDIICTKYKEKCTFEKDFCRWTHDPSSDIKWVRKTGKMLSENIGPNIDHTYSNSTGFYIYLQSRKGDNRSKGKIKSAIFEESAGDCVFNFWYMIKKNQGASLYIYATEAIEMYRNNQKELFSTAGSEEYVWTRVNLPIEFPRPFRILISGEVGVPIDGDLALDDFSFTPECKLHNPPPKSTPSPSDCEIWEFECGSSECIHENQVCDFIENCFDGSDEAKCPLSCSFEEKTTCSWNENIIDDVDWVLAQANDHSVGTDINGPFTDALGDSKGHFLFLKNNIAVDSSNREIGETYNHWHQNSYPYCSFSFSYFANKDIGGDIFLRMNTSLDDINIMVFLQNDIKKSETGKWKDIVIGIGRQDKKFSLSFYQRVTSKNEGAFAIDSTAFIDCNYPSPSIPPGDCQSSEYQCSLSKVCISATAKCDLTDDCGTNEDELLPICNKFNKVTFESPSLGWLYQGTDGVDDDFDWKRIRGEDQSSGYSPAFDHTSFDTKGYYMYVDVSQSDYGKRAVLKSKLLDTISDSCILTFYYQNYGDHSGVLLIDQVTSTDRYSIWESAPNNEKMWKKKEIVIKKNGNDSPFQISIEASVGIPEYGFMALDDVIFSPECKLHDGEWSTVESTTTTPSSSLTPASNNCTASETPCRYGFCIPIEKRCNFLYDCPNGDTFDEEGCVKKDCTFENKDMCGWKIKSGKHSKKAHMPKTLSRSVFSWELIRGKDRIESLFEPFKPPVDHTNSDAESYYLLALSAPGVHLDFTQLRTSDSIGQTSHSCMITFWYWLDGPEVGSINVLTEDLKGNMNEFQMFDGNLGHEWHYALVSIGHLSEQYLIIEARHGISYLGAAAVDDISFVDCEPPKKPPPGYDCQDIGKYQCLTSGCVDLDKICDFSDDCLDMSDEIGTTCSLFPSR